MQFCSKFFFFILVYLLTAGELFTAKAQSIPEIFVQVVVAFEAENSAKIGDIRYREGREYNMGWTEGGGYHRPIVLRKALLPEELAQILSV